MAEHGRRDLVRMACAAALPGGIAAVLLLGTIAAQPVHMPYLPPGPGHPLGTDGSGRDLLLLFGRAAATSLTLGLGAALVASAIGALVGSIAGYRRSVVGDLLMRFTDMVLLIPTLPLVVVLSAHLGPGAGNIFMVIAFTAWPTTARVIHARVLALREQPFIINARSMGAGTGYLIVRHILPNCADLLLAKTALTVAAAMLAEAGLSFLGLGDPAMPSWGGMLHDAFAGAALLNGAWWWALPPLAGLSLTVMVFYIAGHLLVERSGPTGGAITVHPSDPSPADLPPTIENRSAPLLSVENVSVSFAGTTGDWQRVVDRLNLTVGEGEKIAIVGATGSGKSLLLLSILGLLPEGARVSGRIRIAGADLSRLDDTGLRRHRGRIAAYIPQSAAAFNPVQSIVRQVAERARRHQGLGRTEAYRLAAKRLTSVGLPEAVGPARVYPHQLSGGMRQRALLAMALVGRPQLLLADEPTKGLDPASVAAITGLFAGLTRETLLVVTHDLAFARALAGTIVVMFSGAVIEVAPAQRLFDAPLHPYTRALIAAQPGCGMTVGQNQDGLAGVGHSAGCPYLPLCAEGRPVCRQRPPLKTLCDHSVRCWCHAR